jgi:hypothetical protein
MKRTQILTAAGILVALSLGLILAYPLIATQMPTLAKPDIKVTVAYAFISTPLSNSTIPGLARDADDGWQTQNTVFSYLIVMNITNNSDQTIQINSLSALLGPSISNAGGGISAQNLLVNDLRTKDFGVAFNNMLAPHESRLVSLSGMTGIPIAFYDVLKRGDVYVLGSVDAVVAYQQSGFSSATDLRQIPLQTIPEGYLYNSLIGPNQMLTVNGLTADVVPRNLD